MPEVSYVDAERIRKRLHLTKTKFSYYLGVSRMQYWRWQKIGVALTAQKLLRIIDRETDVALPLLMED